MENSESALQIEPPRLMPGLRRPGPSFFLVMPPWILLFVVGLFAAGVRGAEPTDSTERVVDLPPFILEETLKGPPWRLAEAPGLEILSRCPDYVSRHLGEEIARLNSILRLLIPEELQTKFSVPTVIIATTEDVGHTAVWQKMVEETIAQERKRLGVSADDASPLADGFLLRNRFLLPTFNRVRLLPNMRLWDKDEVALLFVLQEQDFEQRHFMLTPDYARFLLENRTPPLPRWYLEGTMTLYGLTEFEEKGVTINPIDWETVLVKNERGVETKRLRELIPLNQFLGESGAARNSAGDTAAEPIPPSAQAWTAESALLIRWALDPKGAANAPALWKYVALASAGVPNEAMFQECFGLLYAEAEARLNKYLPTATRRPLSLTLEPPVRLPNFAFRDATVDEIGRLKGEWERLGVAYVKSRYPALASEYLAQARRTLQRAFERGKRDPRLLAVMGLCECDAGNDSKARELLASAVEAQVIRPRAYYELTRIRYAEAMANAAGSSGRLTVNQTTEILRPLSTAHLQSPPLYELYELAGEVWMHSEAAQTRRNLALLDEGIRLYPHRLKLVYQAAFLNASNGFVAEANALIDRGVASTADAAVRAKFEELRSTIRAKSAP